MIEARKEGVTGRITLERPEALNALTWEGVLAIDAALKDWATDPEVTLLIIDATGEKAFCAGGDIAEMYANGTRGDYDYGRRFWADEYAMNARLFRFPKPVVTLMQGFTMGGGVGVGCHGSHRVVGESSRIAMPECGIGLVPDVGGSLLLARAPGKLGEYLGTTGARMGPGDAIHAGFADYYLPEEDWDALKAHLVETGDWTQVDRMAHVAPESPLAAAQGEIDGIWGGARLGDIYRAMPRSPSEIVAKGRALMDANSPLSMAVAVEIIQRARLTDRIEAALEQEYRFTARAMEHGDFLEGIRAAIIDRDKAPKWRHESWQDVTSGDVLRMTLPLPEGGLELEDEA